MDEPRLLHRRSEHGYTRSAALAMTLEPEAVGAEDQWLLTREAEDRQLVAWATSRRRMLGEIEHLRSHCRDPRVDRACRAWTREIDALDRRLTA